MISDKLLIPGLYVHVPFCVKRCRYCDFLSFGADECRKKYGNDMIARYFSSLDPQLDAISVRSNAAGEFLPREVKLPFRYDTIYIGGGTPGLVDAELIARLLDRLTTVFTIEPDAEITIEVNPCTVTADKLRAYRGAGVNRLSMGVQSLSDRLLGILGRAHSAETAKRAAELAVNYFDNINLDFIFGIPGVRELSTAAPQSMREVSDCLRFAVDNDIAHVSFYSLIIEPGTELYRMRERQELIELPDTEERAMYNEIRGFLSDNGYIQYEISNFAKPGLESRHNLKYWSGAPYTGLGLGAVSFLPVNDGSGSFLRFRQSDDLNRGTDPCSIGTGYEIQERLDVQARKREYMMLGFRKLTGPDPEGYRRLFSGASFESDFSTELDSLRNQGLIDAGNHLTAQGLDFANEIFMMFI
ncbi:MAG: radical SAM family heme chaperone HemW [Clostridia bacterium]|nr:radical SAM family heme chaperone HemW [Clostridia bacterium]